MRLLLVEDDELLGDGIKVGLGQFNYTVDWLKDGQSALVALKTEHFDLIILDLGLPKLSGMDILEAIRSQGDTTPVIILTARESIEDRILGLDKGADDYLAKPFDLEELSARIRSLMRRSSGRADAMLTYKNVCLDPAAHVVMIDDEPIQLPRREFDLLHKLLENAGQVLSREILMQSIYGWEVDVDSNALEVHVHNLRKKLNADYIKTIRGVGYMIVKAE
jgi:two-component system, OmpR family, response regulator QseB